MHLISPYINLFLTLIFDNISSHQECPIEETGVGVVEVAVVVEEVVEEAVVVEAVDVTRVPPFLSVTFTLRPLQRTSASYSPGTATSETCTFPLTTTQENPGGFVMLSSRTTDTLRRQWKSWTGTGCTAESWR